MARTEVLVAGKRVILVDSITEITGSDAGAVIVSGSHGGLSAAGFAAAVAARLYVFNDAGGGKDDAGIAGLVWLQGQGLAACAVSHESARIGDAVDALENGIVSSANTLARGLGADAGRPLQELIASL